LIELLVVIAIIAILSAILFPVFLQAKEDAKAANCISNERNIVTAILMYANDADDHMVPIQTGRRFNPADPKAVQLANVWTSLIQPYTHDKSILNCPDFSNAKLAQAMDDANCDGDGTPGSGSSGFAPPLGGDDNYLADYSIAYPRMSPPGYCGTFGTAKTSSQTWPNAQVEGPHVAYPGAGWGDASPGFETIWVDLNMSSVSESARTAVVGDGATEWRPTVGRTEFLYGCEGQFRHHYVGANYGFLDGHTKYFNVDPERVEDVDDSGCYYEKYFAYDK
jgi:prepilin-type processing-associated H-X9-DG protein